MTRLANNLAVLRRRAARWRSLDGPDRGVYIQAAILLAVIRAALWALPFPMLLRWTERWARPMRRHDPASAVRSRLVCAQSVRAMARYVPAASCLTQSLAVFVLLGRRGDPAALRLGVAKSDEGRLLAHAWVETPDGVCLTAGGQGNFQPLITFDNAPTLP